MAEPSSNLTMTGIPDIAGNFTSNYAAGDGNPNPVVLTPANVIDATPGQPYTATFTISGTTVPVAISVTGATMRYKIGGGALTTTPGTIDPGASGEVELTAPMTGGAVAGGTLVVGGQVTIFSVTSVESETPGPGAWQLHADYRVGQKLPMNVIYPRPDDETTAYAVHRKASASWDYSMRVCVQGGEAPFRFEIISGPSGATIAEEFDRSIDPATGLIVHALPENYATVLWPSPSGTATWIVRVTDQSLDTVDVEWSTETDETAFVYLSTSGSDAAAGTWAAPKETLSTGIWKDDDGDTTYASKIIAFKTAGIYPVYGATPTNACSIGSGKPRSFIGVVPGVILDTSVAGFYGNIGDIAFVNMELNGSNPADESCRILQMVSKNSNYLFWKLKFSNQTYGTFGGDNPSCIMFWDEPSVYGHNIAIVDCILDSTAAMQLITTFSSEGVLVENNSCLDVNFSVYHNGSQVLHMKDDTKNVSVRFNRCTGVAESGMIAMSNQQGDNEDMLALNQEVCYNYVQSSTEGWSGGPISWNQAAVITDNAANTHCYRNTVVSVGYAMTAQRWVGGDAVELSGNAYTGASGIAYSASSPPGFVEVLPVNELLVSGDFDSDGQLTETNNARATYLGKVGWEIATD